MARHALWTCQKQRKILTAEPKTAPIAAISASAASTRKQEGSHSGMYSCTCAAAKTAQNPSLWTTLRNHAQDLVAHPLLEGLQESRDALREFTAAQHPGHRDALAVLVHNQNGEQWEFEVVGPKRGVHLQRPPVAVLGRHSNPGWPHDGQDEGRPVVHIADKHLLPVSEHLRGRWLPRSVTPGCFQPLLILMI